jgi:hypothetical protein
MAQLFQGVPGGWVEVQRESLMSDTVCALPAWNQWSLCRTPLGDLQCILNAFSGLTLGHTILLVFATVDKDASFI